jgi:ribosome-associated protein
MDIRKLQRAIVDGLEDVKAQNILVFNTEALSPLFERVIVASGTSNRQTKALASSVVETVKKRGMQVLRTEGGENGEWIIVDCGAAVAHIMQPNIREFYRLEELWGAKKVTLKLGADAPAAKAPAKKAAAGKTAAEKAPARKARPYRAPEPEPLPKTPFKKPVAAKPVPAPRGGVKKVVVVKAGPSKRVAPAKKAAPNRNAAPAKRAAPANRAAPVKRAASAKKAAPAKRAAPAKKAAPARSR